ncbi:2-succinyl-6-hydroxy-2,4-cyclohexadiene-1-carboxylate synthase [Aquibacillus rhizosphaerae]|uniref:Putative 2-succinyl-6-hydroxy-2,4-cyclohexadiene-1-carboxylate synthase n=1 Tax=Aquibacillus rhizosphaerae TaxID=3051431 RepID=A0ABT7L9M6_9BACI|nr:2-succinyl-6-hydroxy-2,4-cyclohexadiene-1-carboxylate synthase [Aquibacillus sp. LR5S19]MDL4842558.1 2-succinyl-6-hydroxy-2,4-cyclohexadiene-1-carboxylate synthase [Aquibacillus sp. LR5S19]
MYYTLNDKEYWVQDQGSGTPVVLLHGFTGSSRVWDELVVNWKSKYRTISLDLPGHGKSKVNTPISMEGFCKDITELLEKLSIPKAIFVGYSMGGRVALSFAMLYPNKVHSLVLESASPGLHQSHEQVARQAKDELLAKMLENEGLSTFIDYWTTIPLFESQKRLPKQKQLAIRSERINQTETGLASSLRGMGTGNQPSWWDQLAGLTIDVLLIVGELDEKFVKIAKEMDEIFKYSQLQLVADAGHAVHVEQTQKFVTIVSDFIDKKEQDNEWRT